MRVCTHFDDVNVRLVDTPGFDDSNRSDASILGDVAKWLGEKYKQKILLNGVVYLHRITDIRMPTSSLRSIRALRNVCGADALSNVHLATTMWERLTLKAEGDQREEMLMEPGHWGDMIKKGCKVHRLENNPHSALDLVRRALDNSFPVALKIQQEMVDEDRSFEETVAGRELYLELVRERERFEKEKAEILRELEESRAKKEQDTKALDHLLEQVSKKDRAMEKLKSDFDRDVTRERRLERNKYEREKQAVLDQIQEMRRVYGGSQSMEEEQQAIVQELDQQLWTKNRDIESLRSHLPQVARKNLYEYGGTTTTSYNEDRLTRAERELREERQRFADVVHQHETRIAALDNDLKFLEQRSQGEREIATSHRHTYRGRQRHEDPNRLRDETIATLREEIKSLRRELESLTSYRQQYTTMNGGATISQKIVYSP